MNKLNSAFVLVVIMIHQVLTGWINTNRYSLFSAAIYKEVRENRNDNFVISPISLQLTAALAYQGAQGETAEELSNIFYLPKDKIFAKDVFEDLVWDLHGNEHYVLNSANKIYVKHDCKFKNTFLKTAKYSFKTAVESIDFSKVDVTQTINKWVEEKTLGKIKILFSEDVAVDTVSLFINTLFFQGLWQKQFGGSYKKPFYVNSKTQKEIEMMAQDSAFRYHESKALNAKFLELPFQEEKAVMTFVLPNDEDGLNFLEKNIEHVLATTAYDYYEKVSVEIPKFKIETSLNFKDMLQNMGLKKTFTDSAEFPDMVENFDVKIDNMLQKAFLDVNESGVTAIAATGWGFDTLSGPVFNFIADRPFLYYIKAEGVILFIGRYISP